MNKTSIYNTSQNDYMSASNAIGFTHHDPNRHTNNASGFPFLQSSIGGNGPSTTNQNDWLAPTKVYGFSRLVHGGRYNGPSSICGNGQSIPPYQTNFQPRGSSITTEGAGKMKGCGFADVIRDNDKVGPVKKTQFKPRGSNIEATSQIRGGASKKTPTVFRKGRLYSSNYNLPKVHGPPIMYGNATLGLNTDLGINVQPKRQAYFVTGL